MNWLRPKLLGTQPPARWLGGIISLTVVGLITALIDPLRQVSPIASDSVVCHFTIASRTFVRQRGRLFVQ